MNYYDQNSLLLQKIIMGRRSSQKLRKDIQPNQEEWLAQLLPFFAAQGLREVTMDDVVRFLGISKATLYSYYGSKDDILLHMTIQRLNKLRQSIAILQQLDVPYLSRYPLAVEGVYSALSDFSNALLADLQITYPTIWQYILSFIEEAVEKLTQYYENGILLGFFRPVSSAVLALNDRLFLTALAQLDFLQQSQLSFQQAFDAYFSIKLYGIVHQNAVPNNPTTEI